MCDEHQENKKEKNKMNDLKIEGTLLCLDCHKKIVDISSFINHFCLDHTIVVATSEVKHAGDRINPQKRTTESDPTLS
jgi:hypothetical protein